MNHEGHVHGVTKHDKVHWACCILPIAAHVFFAASMIFVVAAWMSVTRDQLVWGYGAQWWIVNALMFGVLALYGRGCKGHGCSVC